MQVQLLTKSHLTLNYNGFQLPLKKE